MSFSPHQIVSAVTIPSDSDTLEEEHRSCDQRLAQSEAGSLRQEYAGSLRQEAALMRVDNRSLRHRLAMAEASVARLAASQSAAPVSSEGVGWRLVVGGGATLLLLAVSGPTDPSAPWWSVLSLLWLAALGASAVFAADCILVALDLGQQPPTAGPADD